MEILKNYFLIQDFQILKKSKVLDASGLQTKSDDPNDLQCVYDLVEFSLAFQLTMLTFNEPLVNFVFELRIDFNLGPITAGVISTTKLFYDIWGDTVNVT